MFNFDFSFSSLESQLLLEIAEKPRSIKFLYRQYVDKNKCSRAGYYKALANLQKKEAIRYDKETGILILQIGWISDGFNFFQQLKRFKKLGR